MNYCFLFTPIKGYLVIVWLPNIFYLYVLRICSDLLLCWEHFYMKIRFIEIFYFKNDGLSIASNFFFINYFR